MSNLPYWMIALGAIPCLLFGYASKVSAGKVACSKLAKGYFLAGLAIVGFYVASALIRAGLNPLDVLLLQTDADQVKNIWGEKNVPYIIPLGYVFIGCSVICMAINKVKFRA